MVLSSWGLAGKGAGQELTLLIGRGRWSEYDPVNSFSFFFAGEAAMTSRSPPLNTPLLLLYPPKAGFERTFVPPCPGDEGIALGCAAFGWHEQQRLLASYKNHGRAAAQAVVGAGARGVGKGKVGQTHNKGSSMAPAPGGQGKLPFCSPAPYWGKGWSDQEIEEELEEWEPWVESQPLEGVK
ncbi:unnamed protein product, partial [Discosporangium mesarthrocarpum]